MIITKQTVHEALVEADIGAGWHVLVHELLNDILDLGWDGEVVQIKSKLAELRCYIGAGSEEVHDRIEVAQVLSRKTCEVCGEPGSVVSPNGWMFVTCPQHAPEKRKDAT